MEQTSPSNSLLKPAPSTWLQNLHLSKIQPNGYITMSTNGPNESYYQTLLNTLTPRLEAANQLHLLTHLHDNDYSSDNSLSSKVAFLESIASIPLEQLSTFLDGALAQEAHLSSHNGDNDSSTIEPFAGRVASTTDNQCTQSMSLLKEAYEIGLKAISRGEVAALLLAGGQGTRLGYDGPKGMYDIGLTSKRTLFQLMAERITKVQMLSGNESKSIVPFFVMTSPLNHDTTVDYFAKNDNFGLDVTFFPQGTLPAMTLDGKIILESPTSVALAPDGNGGIYPAMVKHGILANMKQRGVRYIHVFGVDNALVRPVDPTFVGYCIQQEADCGNKVLWKIDPEEKVGVVATRDGKPCIVEYSDISKEMSERREETTGKLIFGAGNICNHFYTLEFLDNVVVPNLGNMYHVARKKIPYYDSTLKRTVKPEENNGIKLESFIFDVFPLSQSMAVLDVSREDEFAPVKNPPGSSSDSPNTARQLFSNVAKKWLADAGATLIGDVESDLCEVGPMKSYGGEGLEEWNGKVVQCPFSI